MPLDEPRKRSRSETDEESRSKLFSIPKNIMKIKKSINSKNELGMEKKGSEPTKAMLEMEQRKSLLMSDASGEESTKNAKEPFHRSQSIQEDEEFDLEGVEDPFGKDWQELEKEMKARSIYSGFDSYRLRNFIFKANDDLRQELLAVQLIKRLNNIFKEANLSLYLRPYEIIITSHSSGYLETITNSVSIDALKKSMIAAGKDWSLADFFERRFCYCFEEAQKNFVESLAGYSFL